MPQSFFDRVKGAWNVFTNNVQDNRYSYEPSYAMRPDRTRLTRGNERTIITSIFNQIALDVASVTIEHVRTDKFGRYGDPVDSGLNNCLKLEANADQTGTAFIIDLVMSMFDEGCVAVVPVDTSIDPNNGSTFEIESMRVGRIVEWRPTTVKINLYDDRTGHRRDVVLAKNAVAIIENPLYAVMNEPNSTLKRLIHKMNLLDGIDEQSSAGKLDLIIQLPYTIKTEARRTQAEKRRKDIEMQLSGTKYGIAYTDGTEHITQLNRPLENNLMGQIQFLTETLYSQLGMPASIFDGTADEQVMLNYYNRTVTPILTAITDEFRRKFLTKTARSQRQTILFYRDPFKLVPVNSLADIADKFTRNEILSSNEVRAIIGYKPSTDPNADELRNKNLNQSKEAEEPTPVLEDKNQNERKE